MTSRDSYDAIAQSIVALPRMRQVLDKGNQDYDAFTSWLASALREKSTEAQRVVSAAVAMASKDASNKGQIIELGWLSLRRIINPSAPPVQLTEMRTAFYAGAQHLFASIMTILDPEAVRMFTGKSVPALGKCGDLVFRNEEWNEFLAELAPSFANRREGAGIDVLPEAVHGPWD